MEKLYRVKMNKHGMPNFSTAVEVEPQKGNDSDLIRRSDAIKSVLGITMIQGRVPMDTVIYQITSIPAVEPKQGEWIISEVRFGNYKYQCKVCGWHEHHAYNDVKPYNFCPHCGAKMKGADDENDS